MFFRSKFSQPESTTPDRRGARKRALSRVRLSRIALTLLAAFAILVGTLPLPAALLAQESTTPEGGNGETWDSKDPACVNPNPRTAEQAKQIAERCKKTPEEKAQDAQDRQNAEKANEKDESGMNGVPAGYKRNAGPAGAATATEKQADSADQNYDHTQDDLTKEASGFTGLAVGAFQGILEWLYGVTVEKPSEEISRVLTEEAFQLPDVSDGGIGGFYQKVADAVKPGAVLIMLYLGYLMMYQGASYNANVAAQNALPKLFVFFAMIGFMPDLLKMFADLTSSLADAFVGGGSVETFISGKGSAVHSFDDRGFLFVLGHAAAFVMMLLVLFVCGLKNIIFTQLYVLGPIPMLLWTLPGLSHVAAAWLRAMIACMALPLVFAAEFAVGALMINNPGSVFGEGMGNDTVLMSVVITIVVLYVVWRTPKQMLAWSLTGYSASPGIVSSIVKSVVVKRI